MQKNIKLLLIGIILGLIVGFPLGINFGRGDPLLSNPFRDRSMTERMTNKIKRKTGEIVDSARDSLHDATRSNKD